MHRPDCIREKAAIVPFLKGKYDSNSAGEREAEERKAIMRHFLRTNGLTIVIFAQFLLMLFGFSAAGFFYNNQQRSERRTPPLSYPQYLISPNFAENLGENWEGEFLPTASFIFFAAFLYQKGSAASKDPDKSEQEEQQKQDQQSQAQQGEGQQNQDQPEERQGRSFWRGFEPSAQRKHGSGFILRFYSHSLVVAFLILFLCAVALHVGGGWLEYNAERAYKGLAPVSPFAYMATALFWYQSLRNWQSEYIDIFFLIVLTIFLHERGSSQSKATSSKIGDTGSSGSQEESEEEIRSKARREKRARRREQRGET